MNKPSLYEMLKSLDKSGLIPMHMPGHKRSDDLSPELPYSMDVTEIHGFDDLHDVEEGGCIYSICRLAEEAYRIPLRNNCSLSAYPLVGGSTVGILAAVRAMAMQFRRSGIEPKILMARNCHKSVWHAVEIARLSADYILPTLDESGIWGGISPEQIDALMSADNSVKIVAITSPTYEGVISDIQKIGYVVHSHGGLLLVDAAHGAHLPFVNSSAPVFDGADAVTVSLHKTLPALTGCALLLLPSDRLDSSLVARELNVLETSSPSYILLASIEHSLSLATQERTRFSAYTEKLCEVRKKLANLTRLKLYETDGFDYDIGKLVLVIRNGITFNGKELFGSTLADLFRLEGIELEMSSSKHVVAMTSAWDMAASSCGFDSPNIDQFVSAAIRIDKRLAFDESSCSNAAFSYTLPQSPLPAHTALEKPTASVGLDLALGKASACYVWAYPPGIPLVAPGEIFDESIIFTVKAYANSGIPLKIQPSCKDGFWIIEE